MGDTLKEYKRKRHFDQTAEPHGKESKTRTQRLRFVVQHHIARRDHYDFRLEWEGVLKSWAVPKGPSYDSHDKRLAVQVEDHPLEYSTFEGTIPKGHYGGGVVMIWDEGEWEPMDNVGEGLTSGSLKFTLEGHRLKGRWALVRMQPKPGEKDTNWLLIKEKDEYEGAFDIAKFVTSITTGRTMPEIEAGAREEPGNGPEPDTETTAREQPLGSDTLKSGKSTPAPEPITITHPEKILFKKSGVTKGDIAAYYSRVSIRMLPYLVNRILSVVRCPSGIDESCFYKKHPASGCQGIVTVSIPMSGGETEEYFYVKDVQGLLFEVQMNTLEFHTWGSRVETLEQPDVMVFDMDPDEGMDLERIRQGIEDLKGMLDQLSLISYLKTSGGKGYHVVVPFSPVAGWETFHEFARNVAKTMEATWPDRYTSNARKNRRDNRIFIDWLRNGRGATSIAPYSVRVREGAPVSMPITWKELHTVTPNGVSMEDALRRVRRKDPWKGFFDNTQRLIGTVPKQSR